MPSQSLFSQILILFYLAGLFQGLFLIVALLQKKILKYTTNRILLLLFLVITIILTFFLSRITGFLTIPRVLNPLAMVSWFCVSPLFYLYIRSLYDSEFEWDNSQLIYFSLAAYQLYEVVVRWTGLPIGIINWFSDWVQYTVFLSTLYLIHNLVFCYLSIRYLWRYKDKRAISIRWFLMAFGLAATLLFIDGIFFVYGKSDPQILQILIVFFVGFVQYIGVVSIRNSPNLKGERKYQNVKLNNHDKQRLETELQQMMTDQKLYLNPDLNLPELATKLGVQENALSKLFNEHLGTGFYEYLRQYRLLEFERKLQEPTYRHQKIAAIAMDSGFKSKTTFYQAFKEKHGVSPSVYMKITQITPGGQLSGE